MGPEEVEFLTDHGLERLDIICLEVFLLVLMINKFFRTNAQFSFTWIPRSANLLVTEY